MIDVMLIDDDVSIRDYLRDVILWEELGLRLSCEAGDSETARELYQLHRPKIVVMDINIPIISGTYASWSSPATEILTMCGTR